MYYLVLRTNGSTTPKLAGSCLWRNFRVALTRSLCQVTCAIVQRCRNLCESIRVTSILSSKRPASLFPPSQHSTRTDSSISSFFSSSQNLHPLNIPSLKTVYQPFPSVAIFTDLHNTIVCLQPFYLHHHPSVHKSSHSHGKYYVLTN